MQFSAGVRVLAPVEGSSGMTTNWEDLFALKPKRPREKYVAVA